MCKSRFLIPGIAAAFVAMTGLSFSVEPAAAQQPDAVATDELMEEIIVEAPVVKRKVTSRTSIGYATEIVQLRRRVSYADLDLTNETDVLELQKRIEITAEEACEALRESFTAGTKNAADVHRCTQQAVTNTEEDFESVVAAAN